MINYVNVFIRVLSFEVEVLMGVVCFIGFLSALGWEIVVILVFHKFPLTSWLTPSIINFKEAGYDAGKAFWFIFILLYIFKPPKPSKVNPKVTGIKPVAPETIVSISY